VNVGALSGLVVDAVIAVSQKWYNSIMSILKNSVTIKFLDIA